MLDNLVVSGSMINGKRLQVEGETGSVFIRDWMVFTNKNGDKTPNRSYVGNKYVAGVSDHFPVYFRMKVK
jgi:hypothetical protein